MSTTWLYQPLLPAGVLGTDPSSPASPPSVVGAAGATVSGDSTSSSPRVTMPSGIQSGDIALMIVSSNTGSETYSSGANWSGWSQQGSTVYNGTVMASALFSKTCAGTESSQSTGPDLAAGRRWTCAVIVVRGTLDSIATWQSTSTSPIRYVGYEGALSSQNAPLVVGLSNVLGSGTSGLSYTMTPPAGYTEQVDVCGANSTNLNTNSYIETGTVLDGAGEYVYPLTPLASNDIGRQNTWTVLFKNTPPATSDYGYFGIPMA